jgi:hypothetical protein
MPAFDFGEWVRDNPVSPNMIWKDAAEKQFRRFREMGEAIGEMLYVVGHHTSKSIKLPVVAFRATNGWFVLRDNFYGLNLCCLWDFPPDLGLGELYEEKDWDWYVGEVERKKGYTFKGWTSAEIEDPRILRVEVTRDNGTVYWKEVKGEEKDRWAEKWRSTRWYERDWSGGRLFAGAQRNQDGSFGPDTLFYKAPHAFAEGISEIVPYDARDPYEPGMSRFILDTGTYERTLSVMTRIKDAEPMPE